MHSSLSLTSQTGTHLAYWVTPMILSEVQNIDRKQALELVNSVKSKYSFTDDDFKNDNTLRLVSYEVLSNINKSEIIFQ